MMLGNDSEYLELKVVEIQPPVAGATAGGDVHIEVRVRSRAFAGAANAWIDRDEWDAFCQQLDALERTRQGAASLASMSPGELRLNICSLDRAGHVGVEGELTHHYYRAGTPQSLHLEFGIIEFDPTTLPHLVAELKKAGNLSL